MQTKLQQFLWRISYQTKHSSFLSIIFWQPWLFLNKWKWLFVKDSCKEYTNKPWHGSDGVSIIQLTVVLVILHTTQWCTPKKMSPATGHATTLNMLLITKVKVTYSAGFSVRFSSLYKQSAKHQHWLYSMIEHCVANYLLPLFKMPTRQC